MNKATIARADELRRTLTPVVLVRDEVWVTLIRRKRLWWSWTTERRTPNGRWYDIRSGWSLTFDRAVRHAFDAG